MRLGVVDSDGFGALGQQATTGPADPGVSDKEEEGTRQFVERHTEFRLETGGCQSFREDSSQIPGRSNLNRPGFTEVTPGVSTSTTFADTGS